MSRFSKAQLGIALGSLVLALATINSSSLWPFTPIAQVAEISVISTADASSSNVHFSPSLVEFFQAGTASPQNADVILSLPAGAPSPAGYTISLNYNSALFKFTNVESIAPFTQVLGNPNFTNSPLAFTYVKDPATAPISTTIASDVHLARLTFYTTQMPTTGVDSTITFGEATVVSKDQEGNIVTSSTPLTVRLSPTPPPTSDPSTSITCKPVVYKIPNPTHVIQTSNRVAADGSTIQAVEGDYFAYGVEVTNNSALTLTTSGTSLEFTGLSTNPTTDYQKLDSKASDCSVSNNKVTCPTDHLSLKAGESIILPAISTGKAFFVTKIGLNSTQSTNSTYQFTFGRGKVCGNLNITSPIRKLGDLNNDNFVNLFDYQKLIANFGNPYTIFDYSNIIANYGK